MSIYDFAWPKHATDYDARRMDEAVRAAIAAARKSPCAKDQRGAAVWHRNAALMVAECNSPPLPFYCDGSDACRASCGKLAAHAEESALQAFQALGGVAKGASVLHVRTVNGQPVTSGPPSCVTCSRTLLVAGVADVWLWHGGEQWSGWHCYEAATFHALSLQHEKHRLPVIRRGGK